MYHHLLQWSQYIKWVGTICVGVFITAVLISITFHKWGILQPLLTRYVRQYCMHCTFSLSPLSLPTYNHCLPSIQCSPIHYPAKMSLHLVSFLCLIPYLMSMSDARYASMGRYGPPPSPHAEAVYAAPPGAAMAPFQIGMDDPALREVLFLQRRRLHYRRWRNHVIADNWQFDNF